MFPIQLHSLPMFFSEGISIKGSQITLFQVKTDSPNLDPSLYPLQREDSQHPSKLLKPGVSTACTGTMNPPHTTRTIPLDYGCVSKAISNHRYSQDLLRQNCGRSHASLVSLHVSSGNVLIAHSSNTDFQYICKTQQHTLRGRSDSFLSITEGYSVHFSIMALPLQSSFCYSPFFSYWIMGTEPSLVWQDAAHLHPWPENSTALRTPHREFCTRTGWWRMGINFMP